MLSVDTDMVEVITEEWVDIMDQEAMQTTGIKDKATSIIKETYHFTERMEATFTLLNNRSQLTQSISILTLFQFAFRRGSKLVAKSLQLLTNPLQSFPR